MGTDDEAGVILSRGHWVFDLDGTLTVAVHDFAAIRAALEIPEGADILAFLATLPPAEEQQRQARLQEIEEELAARTEPAEGAMDLVQLLHRRGARLGILTRNTRKNALRTLERIGFSRFFPSACVIGRGEAPPKPDPTGIKQLSSGWGTAMDDLVMVGDYLFDLQTGRAAGAATVHVDRTGAFRWPEYTDLGVVSLNELAIRLQKE